MEGRNLSNDSIVKAIGLYAKLAELHEENPFKVKAFNSAAFNLKKVRQPFCELSDQQWKTIPGAGKSVVDSIKEMLETGSFLALNNLFAQTPEGVVAMLKIKGLGPKKVSLIWRDLGIDTVELLFEACRENRLVEAKGFGVKTQQEILKNIEFGFASGGFWHYAKVWPYAEAVKEYLNEHNFRWTFLGDYSRQLEVVNSLELLIDEQSLLIPWTAFIAELRASFDFIDDAEDGMVIADTGTPLRFYSAVTSEFLRIKFEQTSSSGFLSTINYSNEKWIGNEQETLTNLGWPWVPEFMREGEVSLDYLNHLGADFTNRIIQVRDLRGCLHNHTTYSDGLNTLFEMADYAQQLGLQYFGVCDHSQSATYANGLREDQLLKQLDEISMYNQRMIAEGKSFRILSGIESDILGNGDLDYPDEILEQLDLVVASIHSNLSMTEEKSMSRLLSAIENPYTTILGHMTGRLLLLRQGYPVNHRKIIDACAANGVAIELNAHPYRLDIDWRELYYAVEKGVMISINPDAHQVEGFQDMYFGTLIAQKVGIPKKNVLNAMDLNEITRYLRDRK
jgi:DNA polymerase (family 10)